ncbi:MAG: two-component system response regulator [Mycobacterium leprae]
MSSPLVLVVEDDPSVRGLLETLLSTEGYRVGTASDVVAGLVQVSARRPALVLLDVMMPDLDGLRVLDEMAADPALADIPVLVVTGEVDVVPKLRERLGADAVFAKPFSVAELLARVGEITGGPAGSPGPDR